MRGSPERIGPMSYSWTDYSDVVIGLLPPNHGLKTVSPAPQAKVFGDRIAVLWHLMKDSQGRVRLEWTLEVLHKPLEDEERSLNQQYRDRYPDAPPTGLAESGERAFLETAMVGGTKMLVVFNAPTQVGALGIGAHALGVNLTQASLGLENATDWDQLVSQLGALRLAMRKLSQTADQDLAVGAVAGAEQAAKLKDPSSVADYLKRAGRWGLDTATQIGTTVAAEAIKRAVFGS
jgi:hypothetical protein